MLQTYDTDLFYNLRSQYFNKCKLCGVQPTEENQNYSQHYQFHNDILCDRCVDKLNSITNGRSIDEFWLDKDAIRHGYPPFPYDSVHQFIKERRRR